MTPASGDEHGNNVPEIVSVKMATARDFFIWGSHSGHCEKYYILGCDNRLCSLFDLEYWSNRFPKRRWTSTGIHAVQHSSWQVNCVKLISAHKYADIQRTPIADLWNRVQ
jgi:hypothetical protein